MTILIAAMSIALGVSFLCSMLEACLLSLSNSDIAQISENRPVSGKIWKSFKSNIQKPLAVVLIINTFIQTTGSAVSGAQFDKLFGNKWIALFSLGFSLVMIQWAEILPKTIAVRHNRAIARISAVPFNVIVHFFRPFVAAIEWINKPFHGKNKSGTESSIMEIQVLARSALLENLISKEQESLISRSIYLSNLLVRDVMIDRNDINVLSTSMNLQEGLIGAHLHRHTRFPLAENGDIDKIIGYVNFKDIVSALQVNPGDPTMKGIMRPVLYVKGTTRLSELLPKLTRGYQHFAIVQADNGSTIGLVTLEDIIESLVGDLKDEYDAPPDFIIQLSESRFRVGGSVTFRQLKTRVFCDAGRYEDMSIDKWIKGESKGRPPMENMVCKICDLTIKVRRIVRGNVYDCIVERPTHP